MKSKGINARGWFYGHAYNGRAELQSLRVGSPDVASSVRESNAMDDSAQMRVELPPSPAPILCVYCGDSGDRAWYESHEHARPSFVDDFDDLGRPVKKENEQ